MSRRKNYDLTTDHSKGVKSGAVTFIKQQPLIVVEGPSEDSPDRFAFHHHLERSDSGVSDVTMTVTRLMPTERGTPSGGACSNHHEQRESGIFDGDGDIARPDTDCNRLSTLSTDSGRPTCMEGILDENLPLRERAKNTTEEEWEGNAVGTDKHEEHRDTANNSDAPVGKEEVTKEELVKKPWRFSKLENSRPRRYSGSPNTSVPPLHNESKYSAFDKMESRIGKNGPDRLKIPLHGGQSSDSQAGPEHVQGTNLPSDDLLTDCASPGFDTDPPLEENENMNDSQDTTAQETRREPATRGGHGAEQGAGSDAADMADGQVSKTWDHADSCAILPVYDARGKFSHAGGCLELRYNRTTVRLDVPAGAVPTGATKELFIRVLPSRGQVEPTAVFCGPHGTVFEKRVTLSYSTDEDGSQAAVQGFLTPTDFGDPTSWHDISDDPDTSFRSEDGRHHFMLKHFTGCTSGGNGAPQRARLQQQEDVVKTFHLYHDYQVFEANGKMMTFLILRLYIADEDQTEDIEAREGQLGGRPCDAPRCLTFTADNHNPLQISLSHPLEHGWNFVGPHLQTVDIMTIRSTRLTSCQFRLSSGHNAAMSAHCNVELSQLDNTSNVIMGVNIVPPQLQCCCQGRPNRQLVDERHCRNNPEHGGSDHEENLQGAVGGHVTTSHLPVSQSAEETESAQRNGKHAVEDVCPCQNCQVHMEGQSCHTNDACTGCHLCTEESTSETSMPTHPGTASQSLQETSHQTGLSTQVPDHPAQESSQASNPPTELAAHDYPEGPEQNSWDLGAAANPPVPPPQAAGKLHKLRKNVKARFAQVLSSGKQKTKSKPPKEQTAAAMLEDQAVTEVTRGENSRDPNLPTSTQEARPDTQPSKKDSAYISGVPEEVEERVDPPEAHQHLQRDSGVHSGEDSCPQLPGQVSQELGNPAEDTTDENHIDQEVSIKQTSRADQPSKKDSAYISGVPDESEAEDVHGGSLM
ncbi:Hypp202 [Branchiostoma lanceolatum]|uniref:Netrin receptor UNC5 n=1 Tax=Branchiostoma lanceolatum TaxID=7740 RepID=A0A8J9V7B2_BRALA|nr:Hypp202 [Branchiostoma lanceolatum]